MNNSKIWSICCVALALLLLISAGAATALVDPYFHYHKPLEQLEYPINNQRYQNDGIVKHFEYDALITGTSMTENYKNSEFDALFGVNSVKASYSGGSLQEFMNTLEAALKANGDLELVLFCIDEWFLFSGKTMILADGEYPTYLYDDSLANDVKYLLNKDVLCGGTLEVLDYTRRGETTTSFDDYGSWPLIPVGREHALKAYQRQPAVQEPQAYTAEDALRTEETLGSTLLRLAEEYPDTRFLFYFPPYSILNWDNHNRSGTLARQVAAYEKATEVLLEAENIHLFSFCTDFDTITNLDNYRDSVHHSQQVNSLLLQRMAAGEYHLTEENYRRHWQEVLDFYSGYDYDGVFTASE